MLLLLNEVVRQELAVTLTSSSATFLRTGEKIEKSLNLNTLLNLGVTSNLMSSPCVTPAPSQENIKINLTPFSTQFEVLVDVPITIIVASIIAAVVVLVSVTIALMIIAILVRKSYHHCSRKNGVPEETTVRDHEDQIQEYDRL